MIRTPLAFAARNRLPYRSLTLDDHEADALAVRCSIDPPTPAPVARRLGLGV